MKQNRWISFEDAKGKKVRITKGRWVSFKDALGIAKSGQKGK